MPSRVPTFRRPRVATHKPGEDSAWKRFLKTAAWQRCRASYLGRNPVCVRCYSDTCMQPATEVHHTKGQDMEHTFDEDTFMALCKPCHSRITARETRRA
jgi:5-methylcytosine-specific restriction endonuclease McrA